MLACMLRHFLDPGQPLLDGRFPLPLDHPFTRRSALQHGLQSRELSLLCDQGYLRRLVPGVYVVTQVPDSLTLRAEALRLVVPDDAVVTDRTAAWLHGARTALAPGDHQVLPPVSVFVSRRGARLRNGLSGSGQRMLSRREVVEVDGVRVTTPVRTACDLGRLLRRDAAFAALDSLLGLGAFTRDDLWEATDRFRGMRGVRQLRGFVPFADGRAQSPGESVTRLRWLDLGTLPPPELQVEVRRPGGWSYWLDLGVEDLRFAVEYDGEEWHHRTTQQREHDERRRTYLREEEGWLIEPVTKANVWGAERDIEGILLAGHREARRRLGTSVLR